MTPSLPSLPTIPSLMKGRILDSFTPIPVTLGGAEITDAVRLAGLQGDGLSPESSIGLWQSTTNLVINGGFETNLTGWNDVSATSSRITSQCKFGAAGAQVVTGNATAVEGFYHNFTATVAVYTVSAWVRGAGGGTVRMAVRDNAGANAQTGTAVTLTSTWQRIKLTTTNLTAATWRCYVETNTQQSITFQVDGVQAEQRLLATPYVETDGGTAARAIGSASIPFTSLDETQGWVAIRCRMGWVHTAEPYQYPEVFNWRDDGSNYIQIYGNMVGNTMILDRVGGGVSRQQTVPVTWADAGDITIIAAWTNSNPYQKISFNGSVFSTSPQVPTIPTLAATTVQIGGRVDGNMFDATYHWVAWGTGTLTDANAAAIHAFGNTDPLGSQFPTAAAVKMVWNCADAIAKGY